MNPESGGGLLTVDDMVMMVTDWLELEVVANEVLVLVELNIEVTVLLRISYFQEKVHKRLCLQS